MLLTTAPEIKAAIATMNPIAREAAEMIASHLLQHPEILSKDDELQSAAARMTAMAMVRNGISLSDRARTNRFFEDHGVAIMNVALSIVTFVAKEQERKRKWGWLGKAAAVGAGVLLGSLFG